MIKIINIIEKYTIIVTLFLYPIIVLTSFVNNYDTPKLLILFLSVVIIFSIKLIKMFLRESIEINIGKFDLFMISFGTLVILSGFLSSPNVVDAFFLPGNASFIVLSVVFYFFVNQSKELDKNGILNTILASFFATSVLQIISAVGITNFMTFLPEIIRSKSFNPYGSFINSIVITASILPIIFYKVFNNKDLAEKILLSLVGIIMVISISSSAYLTVVSKNLPHLILNYKVGWSIAVDSIKENPLLGVGPSNFSYAFNKFRPIYFNLGDNWNLKYMQNSSQFLTILSEIGIVGAILFIYLAIVIYKNSDFKNPIHIGALTLIIATFLLPLSTLVYLPLFVLLSVGYESKNVKLGLFLNKIPKIFVAIPVAAIILIISYYGSKTFYGEYVFTNSIKNLNNNNPLVAYSLVNKAVSINSYVDRYHLFSAVINISLAEQLASKKNLTDEDRTNITNLIQQSIREVKASVAVNPKKSANWEAMSDIYRTIISFAKGSESFATESLRQSIALDPINPNLRIKLGSLYFALKQNDLAIESFKLAILAKQNLPNAHYNLAVAYKENKELAKAKDEINTTLLLLGKETADYDVALKELQKIEELSKPTDKIEPIIEPQIELNQ